MAQAVRSRVVDASCEDVWRTAGDLRRLARWWPRVVRVEGIDDRGFTEVLRTDRGRNLRADYVLVEVEPGRSWHAEQALDEGPFAAVFTRSSKWLELRPIPAGGTRISVGIERRMRGRARLGSPLLRRATRRQAQDAVDALAEAIASDR